jgi:hypothetical protein
MSLRIQERLQHAVGLAEILDVAYEVFEQVLLASRAYEDPGTGLFTAAMMATVAAADGRDAVAFAPSLPSRDGAGARAVEDGAQPGKSAESIADAVGLSRLLVARLAQAMEVSSDPDDRAACANAVNCAERIYGLLHGSAP